MTPQEFDKIVRKKISEVEFTPPRDGWERIASELSQHSDTKESDEGKRPFIWSWSSMLTRVAAVLLIATSSIALWNHFQAGKVKPIVQESNNSATKEESNKEITAPTDPIQKVNENNSSTQNNSSEIIPSLNHSTRAFKMASDAPRNNKSVRVNQVKVPVINNTSVIEPGQNIDPVNQSNPIVLNEPINTTIDASQVPNTIKDSVTTSITQKQEETSPKSINNVPAYFHTDPIPAHKSKWNNKAIAVQVGTSMINENPELPALQLGVSNQSNVNGRLYTDISVSYINNNPSFIQSSLSRNNPTQSLVPLNTIPQSSSDLDAYGVNPQNNTFRAGGNVINVNELQSDSAVIHAMSSRIVSSQLQALPMLGLNVSNKLRVAAGIDANRILATQKFNEAIEKLSLFTREPVVMRKWDAGVSAKAEAKITKRINIGYRQRIGLTNLVKNNAGLSTRRNYSDIILRYNLR